MRFISAAVSDRGNVKKTNQDSLIIKVTDFESYGQVAMVIVCDGMGGYSKGELASATVINSFEDWFNNLTPEYLEEMSNDAITNEWTELLSKDNLLIRDYGKKHGIKMGTTFSGIILYKENYQIVHVGDSRIYFKRGSLEQLTEDHSLVAREVRRGNLTAEEAKVDSRRNVLTQCVGLSKKMEPHTVCGKIEGNDIFLLCSDGLYHTCSDEYLTDIMSGESVKNVGRMRRSCMDTIHMAKHSGEKDNLTMILLKCVNKPDRIIEETEIVQDIKMINTDEEIS